ncbi:helicase-related protein [Ligilactobacillus ruminis]|uniref:ATP-dependent helicase n=1 Tax=Ligilactobacillus ruminis TaxID=1623 RepID=A0A6A8GM13_9LACO|nr:helicase-related protein [Ligilactobacillus ruminis]MSA20037.1 ATP-dependent helicase [Ligilactobacillus ruminis]MSA22111.1 ATP-dependent helicase [Ligilactobacillus ruminis]MSA24074.1 ATP-dependent helicase [Ligilactobacillus ruminis]MSA34229.1 ATP-dependent helicase [Ligilactobacillus ruminis]MSA40660.1 ATP-dependent helicase [Ligilactobacillus ruminis]
METFNNITKVVRDDLEKRIKYGSKVSIAAACFSIYAYQALKNELEKCDEFRFIFTSPTFVAEKTQKERREFYIPRLNREKSLYGTEFELRLRNELKQKAVARECAEWMRKKAQFRTNTTHEGMNNFLVVDNPKETYTYIPMNSFTAVDLGCERGNNISNMSTRLENPASKEFMNLFESVWQDKDKLTDVTSEVIDMISTVYQENSPELIYFMTLYNIFNEFLDDISEDVLPNEATGFKGSTIWNKLYDFQKDAVLGIVNKLETYNGCILADSVGLGKTFTALAVIKYYEGRNKNVLVLCPKKLSDNWMTYRSNVVNNPLEKDRFRYDVLYHTDLSRNSGITGIGIPIDRINWGNYDLVVIDESHNFRNGNGTNTHGGEKENRYMRLMNRVIKPGVKTKVLMLSATPVNNRFYDLRNQLALAYEGNPEEINEKLNTKSDIDSIFRQAQKVYNAWCKLPENERTTKNLLSQLDFDFFEVLDSVTIARSRHHIQNYYDTTDIGTFPKRNKPISLYPKLTDRPGAINYKEVFECLNDLKLTIYTPTKFILPSKLSKYLSEEETENFRKGRETGIQRLMSINLLKRMESSVHSFLLTVKRVYGYLYDTSQIIEQFINSGTGNLNEMTDLSAEESEFDDDDQNTDFFTVGKKVQIDIRDMDYISWKRDIDDDLDTLSLLIGMVEDITPKYDFKLNQLIGVIKKKEEHPINPGNKKVLIFTAFADTAEYLYENIAPRAKELGLNTALVTGSVDGRTTIPNFQAEMNHVLCCFSPVSKDRDVLYPKDKNNDIDILIGTDCISEGQNLQDCDYCINYDIHWNPVRIIQRFGRIDRIGSKNKVIQIVNFWPNLTLDEYINLKARVETRMKISVMTSTGDDDLINPEEKGDLEYRKAQLKKLQEEVVDLEDMTSGVSIMDLGLNDFRMDLLAYMKEHKDIDHMPFGIHAVAHGDKPGVIFVLKNVNQKINIKNQNRLHPFYMVYVGMDGEIITNHLQPKDTLDEMRHIARGKTEPDKELCKIFNKETRDGRDMGKVSGLLEDAIGSIIEAKDEEDIDSFFTAGKTSFQSGGFSGIEDFELICFMVVM